VAYLYLKKGHSNNSDEKITCYPIIYATRLIRLALGLLKISVSYTKKKKQAKETNRFSLITAVAQWIAETKS